LSPAHFRVTTTDFTERFKKEIGALPPELKAAAKDAIRHLKQTPPPAKLKLEKLKGYKNPSIYSDCCRLFSKL
jgi:mRNA-degrading endonuclease RelE of RelBE toxin-antitoxin system